MEVGAGTNQSQQVGRLGLKSKQRKGLISKAGFCIFKNIKILSKFAQILADVKVKRLRRLSDTNQWPAEEPRRPILCLPGSHKVQPKQKPMQTTRKIRPFHVHFLVKLLWERL